jgi:hypothetical protein
MKTVEPKNFFERGLDKIMPGRIENAAIETSGQALDLHMIVHQGLEEAVGDRKLQ